MQTREVSYKGKKLFYRVKGAGSLVVLLHGFGEDGSVWKAQFDLFPNFQLLVPDLPGSGSSEAVEDMSMEGLADAVNAVIQTFFEGQKIILIGHSMGGYVALAFAEKHPKALSGLGLFHSTAFADSEAKKETRQKGIRFIESHGAAEFLKTTTPGLFSPKTKEEHPGLIDELLASTRNFSADCLVSYYKAMMQRPDRTTVLKNSEVPVLFVMGRHDTAVPLQDGLAQCHLPGMAYIHVLEHSGHMGMVEEREKTARLLVQFVNLVEKHALT